MNVTSFKYNQKLSQQWLLYVGLVLNVFAFSGFNDRVASAFHEHTQTELVDSKNIEADFVLNDLSVNETQLSNNQVDHNLSPFNTVALLNFKVYLFTKFKSVLSKTLAWNLSSVRIPIKLPACSPSGDNPHHTIG